MNPANYRLSKEILQEMLDEDFNKKYHRFQTHFDKFNPGLSSNDLSQKALDELYTFHLSEPLKKMKIDYL